MGELHQSGLAGRSFVRCEPVGRTWTVRAASLQLIAITLTQLCLSTGPDRINKSHRREKNRQKQVESESGVLILLVILTT